MMSPFAQMAPLNVASTLEDNRASLPRRRVGESEISTCSKRRSDATCNRVPTCSNPAIRKLSFFYLHAPYSFPEIMRLALSPRASTNFFSMSVHYIFSSWKFLLCALYLPFYQPCVNRATKSHTNTYTCRFI